MAQNSPIFVHYNGVFIIESMNGCRYELDEPAYIPGKTIGNRDYAKMCDEIYKNLGWSYTDILLIRGRLPYLKKDVWHYRSIKIINDEQLYNFTERVINVGLEELEIYVDYVQSKESHIGTSSRSNVIADAYENEIIEPVLDEVNNENEDEDICATFDLARVSNTVDPEIDDEENELDEEPKMGSEDEEEIYRDGEEEREIVNHQTKFIYTEEGEMVSVGSFDNAPAAEFEDSLMWEYSKNDVISGMNVSENDDKILYKGRAFETKSELQSVIRAYSIKNHREIIVTNSNKIRYIVFYKLKDEGSRGCN